MKLRHILPLVLACVFLVTACEQQGNSIAVADLQRVMRDCDAGKKGVDKLNAMAREAEEKLKPLQEKLDKKPDDADLQAQFQQMLMPMQQRMQSEQQNMMNQLVDATLRVVNKYREEKGYSVILPADVAFSNDPRLDITNELIAAVNKENIQLSPLPEPKQAEDKQSGEAAPEAASEKKADTAPASKEGDAASKKPAADKK